MAAAGILVRALWPGGSFAALLQIAPGRSIRHHRGNCDPQRQKKPDGRVTARCDLPDY
ncbi:hypothetical protein [Paracoccus sp. (in: a-proteobacteria)]|uniref:hypothetical protein n=1 Tax=Paracoccus sp. TaxID=267 RepID=UPI0035AFB61B